jgi:hypothetical protein
MRSLNIDSLVLQIPGLPEFEAKRLALEITRLLAVEELGEAPDEIPRLQVQVPAPAKTNIPHLARQIVAEMMREIRRAT